MQTFLHNVWKVDAMTIPDTVEREELQHRAERLADETILSESEAIVWIYTEEGYSSETIGDSLGKTDTTVRRTQRNYRDQLRTLWRTIELLDLEEGQVKPDPDE